MLEEETRIRRRLALGGCDPVPHRLLGLAADRLGHLVGEDPGTAQIALVPADALALALLLDPPPSLDADLAELRRILDA